MNDYYDINDPSIRTLDGRLNYNKLDYRPLMIHEVPQTAPLHNDNGTYNLDRLGQLINRFSDGKHPEMVASLQRQLDAETARINTGYQNARNDFAQVGANLPQTYDLAGDYKHAQAMNAINYDKIRRNQASAPRQAGYYSSTLPQLPEYDTMNRDAMAYQEEQRRIAAEKARQEAAERAYLQEQARKEAERKRLEEQKRKANTDDYGFDYGAQGEGQSSMWEKPVAPTTAPIVEKPAAPTAPVAERPLVARPAEAANRKPISAASPEAVAKRAAQRQKDAETLRNLANVDTSRMSVPELRSFERERDRIRREISFREAAFREEENRLAIAAKKRAQKQFDWDVYNILENTGENTAKSLVVK